MVQSVKGSECQLHASQVKWGGMQALCCHHWHCLLYSHDIVEASWATDRSPTHCHISQDERRVFGQDMFIGIGSTSVPCPSSISEQTSLLPSLGLSDIVLTDRLFSL